METRRASESYKGGLKHLVSDIGMSEANLHRCLNNNKIQAGDLEIASLLGVSILTFFDEKPVDNKDIAPGKNSVAAINSNIDNRQYYPDSPDVLRAQIRMLDNSLKEKDAQINKLLEILMNK